MESRANGRARPPTNTNGIALDQLTSISVSPHDRYADRDHQGSPSNHYHGNNDTVLQSYPNANRNRRREPSRHLTAIDVAALIINKMIGTGIFVGPYVVLINSRSKAVALGLWFCGLGYTILSMIMYFEFARKLPFTGGELVYLEDMFHRYPLLATTLYAFYFVFVYTTSTNAMQFAAQVLLASSGRVRLEETTPDENSLRFLAVAVTTAVCMMLYLSNSNSRLINRATALLKLLLLLIIACFGMSFLVRVHSYTDDWYPAEPVPESLNSEPKWQTAFITILYSFHGWENATLVSGEIPSFSVLRKGTQWAVAIVGVAYLLIAILVSHAFSWNGEHKPEYLRNYTAVFFDGQNDYQPSTKAAVATAVLIALSAIGSMISVTYTCVRASIEGIDNAITFSADLLVYGHFVIEAAVGFGFIWFRPVDDRLKPPGYPAVGWFPENSPPPQTWWTRHRRTFDWSIGALTDGGIQVLLGATVCVGSLGLITIDAWTGYESKPADFVHLIIMISLMIIGCFYWWFLIRRASAKEIYKLFGYDFRLLKHGVDDHEDAERVCSFCQDFQDMRELREIDLDHRHPHHGFLDFVEIERHGNLD
ncbi:high-affinity methionine permease [Colletotrichum nymphaeae SA-01]|uniref:High-affinity methionine permease n=1 Tax=Colletotrichum nymphaeae SA-01 TaxID=1460502 RepID=A0A135UUH2_9PEZI|nr:high-affinity methionine permease [Colletotrichum nymphaeae SA-01]